MRVFDFTLLSGYEFSGVDVAQGFRARLFAKNNVNAKFIFTELPTIRDMELYGSQKIKRGQIMSAHLFMTGRLDMSLSVKKEALLENEKENYEYDNIDEDGKVIRLYNSGEKSVEILCDEDGFVINESLFKNGKKYLENYYTDSLSYTELYNWDNDSNDGLNLGRRIFWNKQGQMVYEQCIYKDNVEYLFKNGEVIDNVEFLERFVKTLNLYSADIIYTTNGTLGFDFLFDNLVKKKEDRFLCDFHYVIIDEADSVLLDSAIMPLVISGVPRVQSNLYDVCDFFVTTLVEDIDYIEEDKAVWLTPKGVKFAESFFGISNFYGKENFEINRHVTLSLRAHKLLKNKKDYVVTDKKEVELFDGATGRLMHGVKLRGGQHQAIEAKEKVEISQEYRTVASVTFQNLFMMFDKMAGMSGTLMDAKDELFETYGKHVVRIPTNRPLKRVDRKDRYFKNGHDQFWTAVDDVIRLHETGQPVLVVLNSVTDTDLFSRLLIEKNIPHNVLNASNAFWEAQIIAGAGQLNAVTVATTMAGRGTDIKLGDGVKELGGLAVIGIGRMNNSRSERQARGRAGRQGDPGFSQYYVSLEDDIVGAEDDDKLQRYIDGKKRIGKRKIKRIVNQCQKLSVESEEMNRKKSLQYDQVLQRQRDLIYATRKNLLDGASVEQEKIVGIAKENISDFVNHFDCIQSNKKHGRRRGRKKDSDKNTNTQQYTSMLNRYILDNISYKLDAGLSKSDMQSAATVDIYGKGGDEAKLKGLIGRLGCADYVHLMGQQKLDDVYKHYDAYVAASQSEGFGLTLMEAIGSGLPIVGFDVRYGNQTFIDDGQNGYKIPITDEMDQKEKIKLLSERIVRMFTEDDMDAFSGHSYEKAKEYLTKEVVHRWIELLK